MKRATHLIRPLFLITEEMALQEGDYHIEVIGKLLLKAI
jgi:hypothetical protein